MWLSAANGEGPLVIKLAGIAAGVRLFHEEVNHAAAHGFRAVELETSGERHTDPATGPITWESLAGEVVAGIDRCNEERAILWGTSFGSTLALATAVMHPERVAGLLLCFPPDPRWQFGPYLKIHDWVEHGGTGSDARASWAFRVIFAVLNAWEFAYPPMLARMPMMLREGLDARTPDSTLRAKLRLLMFDDPGLPPDGLPVSLILGKWDLVAPAARGRLLARRIPGAHCRSLWACGHQGCFSRPRTYNRMAVEELKRIASRA